MTDNATYIRLDITESAALHDVNTLLPRDTIYQPLQGFVEEALKLAIAAKKFNKSLNEVRSHNAVSLDGDRGTGKSSVVVNLASYLKLQSNTELQRVHVLAPTDPTLLEDGESLFLHVIIASVLHDKDIKAAQKANPTKCQQLNKQLEKLAHAMESIETQHGRHGIDKIRAQFSNKHLADCVHDFFKLTLELLDKDLLVMPIDDVDTSLNRAFENLEVIRKYLTTPFVLPIVTGDRALYNDVTWRDFHGRLTKDSNYERGLAADKAKSLANEYQRKILPVPRRLMMPEVKKYWATDLIKLRGADNQEIMPLQNFIAWLEIFISGPVNGLESSQLQLPIYSMRALTQLLSSCRDLIPRLPDNIKKAKNSISVKRAWHMPDVDSKSLEEFEAEYLATSKKPSQNRNYSSAYKAFSEITKNDNETEKFDAGLVDYKTVLLKYFQYEKEAGAVYLVLLAQKHWESIKAEELSRKSVFDTPIFQPLVHDEGELSSSFIMSNSLSEWEVLNKYIPVNWINAVSQKKVLLPYPVADLGINIPRNLNYWEELDASKLSGNQDNAKKTIALIDLMAQRNFYGSSKRWTTLNIGRLFELIITSLLKPLDSYDIDLLRQRAPFFSVSSLAPTKKINDDNDDDSESLANYRNMPNKISEDVDDIFSVLQEEVLRWRLEFEIDKIHMSPWLVYKVFNKVYSQVASYKFSQNGEIKIASVIDIIGLVFYSTWAAFGSFEKGEIFGLPTVVSTVNLHTARNFDASNDLFNVNLRPFALTSKELTSLEDNSNAKSIFDRINYGKKTRTVSYVLASHPLRMWIDSSLSMFVENEQKKKFQPLTHIKIPVREIPRSSVTNFVKEFLGLSKDEPLRLPILKRRLISVGKEERNKFLAVLSVRYSTTKLAKTISSLIYDIDHSDDKSSS